MPQVTIIIPTLTNTKGLDYLLTALKDFPLIVIDNSPTPDKRSACKKHPHCTYLPQTKNQGFARAINLAARRVKTEWLCILNDDIEFPTLPFAKLIARAREKNWSAISPVLMSPSGNPENLGYQILPQGKVMLNYDPSTINHQLDGLTAACLVIKTSVFRMLGGFDARFFAYLEDVDLFLRLKRAGHGFGIGESRVVHNHMTTSSKMNNFKAKMDLKNWIFVVVKNWSPRVLIANLPSILLERLRNLSGLAKSTWRSYHWRALYILPLDLLWIIKEIIIFPIKKH